MGINTLLASSNGEEVTINKFADMGDDYVMPSTIQGTEDLLGEIGTALFWIHSMTRHTNNELESVVLRSKSLERSFRDIGELVMRAVIENGGQLMLNGEVVS